MHRPAESAPGYVILVDIPHVDVTLNTGRPDVGSHQYARRWEYHPGPRMSRLVLQSPFTRAASGPYVGKITVFSSIGSDYRA
ncbi:hypothetical protein J6590_094732 [Homalodisca vitripennis]|nr:hypothetical protein J6590_094732 [Homalodisca vitripennis]